MAGHRPTDWHVLDLDKDPTPGDPERVRKLARFLHDFADDVSEALRLVKGMAGEGTLAEWAGKSATVFKEEFSGVPKNLKKLEKSYALCGDALADYWPKLERAQALADKALAKAREAQADLSSAQSKLASAESWVGRATKEADKYKDDPTGSKSDADKPDEAKVRAATRDVQSAKSAHTKAQSDVTSAQNALDAAKKMAADARKMREEAARDAKSKIDEASDAGIQNRSWWEEIGDWFTDNWDNIVAACKIVVAVVGIVAMIIGGPILGAIVLIAALVVLADTLYKYSKGQASLWDVGLAALDCIPGMKGLTTLGGLAKGLKGGAAALAGLRGGLKGMALTVRGLGKTARKAVADGAAGAYNRLKAKIRGCGDPVDVATGYMFLTETDLVLPGTLKLGLTRRVSSGYRCGWWFGPGWASTLDQRLECEDDELVFVTEDGMLLVYREPDVHNGPCFPESGPRMPLERSGDGDYRVTDPVNGIVRYFSPAADGVARIASIADRNGNTITFVYDEFGAPLEIRHSGGYRVKVTVEDGRVTALALADTAEGGSSTLVRRFAYAEGNLTEVVNASGRALRYSYDQRLRISSWTDRNGHRYAYEYDDRDRCVSQGGDSGHVAGAFSYDGADPAWPDCHITTHTAPDGAVTRFVIGSRSQLVAEIDPLGAVFRCEYDEHHHLLSRTDALGNTTFVENNMMGQPTRVVFPDGGAFTVTYDSHQRPVRLVQPDGTAWEHEYDDRGSRVATTAPDGAVSRYAYDERGGLAAVTDPQGATTRVRCNTVGLPTEITSPLGDRSVRTYDAFGRLSSVTDSMGHTTRIEWADDGGVARTTGPDGAEERWSYDAEGNCVSHAAYGGGRTTFEYGPFDLLTARTEPDGSRYEFAYDASLRLVRVTNPLGLTWRYEYDLAGRLVRETDFNEQCTSYELDAAGRISRRTNPAGQSVGYRYDAVGRLTAKSIDGAETTYAYNRLGKLIQASGPDSELFFERDDLGRIVEERVNGRALTVAYDSRGRRVERRTPSGASSRYDRDRLGRVTHLRTGGHSIDFEYDPVGQEISRLVDGSLRSSRAWDPVGRIMAEQWSAAGRSVRSRSYDYGPHRHLAGFDDSFDGRLDVDVDSVGRVRALRGAGQTEEYVYDAAGNLSAASWAGHGQFDEAVGERRYSQDQLQRAGAVRFTYDDAGRIVERRRSGSSRREGVWQYSWDADDRLTSVVAPDGTVWHYQYDPLGRRTAKLRLADDGVVERTEFTWDGPTLVEQRTTDVRLTRAVALTWEYDGMRPVAQNERLIDTATQEEVDSRFFAIVTDLVGTPTELVDPQGTVAWRARSTVWGVTAWHKDSQAYTPLRFPGQYYDAESGLHYNFHRYYAPDIARYISLDPLGLAPSPSPYGYVTNPLRQFDPFGLMSCDETVTLYHGSRNWTGDQFSLGRSNDLQREYTPDAGVYLTDDFNRAATQYAGPEGVVVRTEVPREFAESVLREHSGPAGRQPEYFVDTPEGVDILNAGNPQALPQREAIIRHMMGQF